ncbi:probable inactive leucine-rich repeat receptor-like protein kinase At3g03770 [Salvia splendens]|uniref:probable inactive leucine-rich repeat receptor-like protein kinase At3g03770 n=1 Tax=Salvia splendens TaxID=180675 RepID=UPI001C254E61|nr:probable inactive leucine-rich repeat receptor-like protein kinase At3g03770 [Salvia splendens]
MLISAICSLHHSSPSNARTILSPSFGSWETNLQSVPEWLDSWSNLTVLSLKNNRLNGEVPSAVARITTLIELVLSHNFLTGKMPDLSKLSTLQLLDLRENSLDSTLPPLPKGLVNVFLSKNSFSGSIPEQFVKLEQLQHLDLSNNHLTGTLLLCSSLSPILVT